MCELLIKAVDARMPTVAEWRAWLALKLPEFAAYVAAYPDVPEVEANQGRLEDYEDAAQGLAMALLREAKAGKAVLSAQQKLDLAARINAYEANPLTDDELAKVRAYFDEENDNSVSVVSRWKSAKYHVDIDSKRTDEDKARELAEKDERGCYKRGDIVGVEEDGYAWGREEGPPRFYIIKIPGLSVADARKYEQPDMDRTTDPSKPRVLRRRLFRVPVDLLPLRHREPLLATGTATLTRSQVGNYLINKTTGQAE